MLSLLLVGTVEHCLSGSARLIHRRDEAWRELDELFEQRKVARQIINLTVMLVLKSCGFGVPVYDFIGERDTLRRWEEAKGEAVLHQILGRTQSAQH